MKVNYDYVRSAKAEELKEWYGKPLEVKEQLSITIENNAILLPLKKFEGDQLMFGRGGVVDASGKYIDNSGMERRMYGKYEIEKCDYRDKSVVYCGYLINHWGHFLVESVTRLWYFLHEKESVDKYVFLLEENNKREISGNYREFFQLLGILDKVETISSPVKYKKVIIPERAYVSWSYYSPLYKEIFDVISEKITKDKNVPNGSIYLSRSKLKKAKDYEIELDSMDSFFSNNGYDIIYPEQLSLSALIQRIRASNCVATMSGSAQHNMLFAMDGQELQILERFPINIEFQAQINMIRNLDCTYIDVCYPLYPTDLSGPLILGYTNYLKHFAESQGYCYTVMKECQRKRIVRRVFSKYMKSYRKEYGYSWFSMDWYFPRYSLLYEGYLDSTEIFGEYLSGNKTFSILQLMDITLLRKTIGRVYRRIIKQ